MCVYIYIDNHPTVINVPNHTIHWSQNQFTTMSHRIFSTWDGPISEILFCGPFLKRSHGSPSMSQSHINLIEIISDINDESFGWKSGWFFLAFRFWCLICSLRWFFGVFHMDLLVRSYCSVLGALSAQNWGFVMKVLRGGITGMWRVKFTGDCRWL